MSRLDQRLIDGHIAAKDQRERLKARLSATRDRLAPRRLIEDARTEAERQVRAAAGDIVADFKGHPVRTAMLGGAMLAWVFRHPLIEHGPGWLKRAYAAAAGRRAEPVDDAGEADGNMDKPIDSSARDAEPCAIDIVQQIDSH